MKKLVLLCLMLASFAMIVAGCGGSDTAKKDAQQKIVIGLDDSFPPMGFRDEKMRSLVSISTWQKRLRNVLVCRSNSKRSTGAAKSPSLTANALTACGMV